MLKIPSWKIILSIIICFLSIYISIPSLFDLKNSAIASFFPDKKVNLGLDLRGGSYILIEMEIDAYEIETFSRNVDAVRNKLRKLSYGQGKIQVNATTKEVTIPFSSSEEKEEIRKAILESVGSFFFVSSTDSAFILTINSEELKNIRKNVISQSMEIIRRRVDETGTKELDLQRQGDNYILLQVPGVEDPGEIKRILGKTAKLSFHLVESSQAPAAGVRLMPYEDPKTGRYISIPVQARPILTGDMLVDAQTTIHNGAPIVSFKFNNLGAKLFGDATAANTGRALAIVLDNVIISAPSISEPILSGSGIIQGSFTVSSASELALLLRAGALPVPLKIIEERSVGPSLGLDSIESGKNAALLGSGLVVVFMFIFYYFFGMIANLALVFNFFMLISIMALFGATLTLPGIAGIVLTLGMAVDANVLIFERIREELTKGRTPMSAIDSGFEMAFGTIFDSNITTILTGVILYVFGTGPIKGFAVTMVIGIICSMFTAVMLSKIIIATWYRRRRPETLVI